MIASGYTLDLYCDNEGEGIHAYGEGKDQFFDEHGSECRKQARAKGWKIVWTKGIAICPKCSGKVPKE